MDLRRILSNSPSAPKGSDNKAGKSKCQLVCVCVCVCVCLCVFKRQRDRVRQRHTRREMETENEQLSQLPCFRVEAFLLKKFQKLLQDKCEHIYLL